MVQQKKNHFFFAVSSIFYYAKAMNVDVASYDLEGIIKDYLDKKAAVMEELMEVEQLSF